MRLALRACAFCPGEPCSAAACGLPCRNRKSSFAAALGRAAEQLCGPPRRLPPPPVSTNSEKNCTSSNRGHTLLEKNNRHVCRCLVVSLHIFACTGCPSTACRSQRGWPAAAPLSLGAGFGRWQVWMLCLTGCAWVTFAAEVRAAWRRPARRPSDKPPLHTLPFAPLSHNPVP